MGGTYRRPLEGRQLSQKLIEPFLKNRFLGFDPYAPCVKKFAIRNNNGWAWEKDINGVVYFWQWLLYTHVIGVVESPTTVYMRDDWEKLSDEKSFSSHALWLGQASWVTRKVVCMHVVAVFQIVHELWVVSHESFTCFTTSAFTLYTYYIELSTGGHTVFVSLCASNVYTTSGFGLRKLPVLKNVLKNLLKI